jgi:hypothetical protein
MELDERAFVNLLSTSPIIPKIIYKKRFTTLIGTPILSFGTKEQEVVLLVILTMPLEREGVVQ